MFWNDIKYIKKEVDELKKDLFRFDGMLTTHIADMQETLAEKDPRDKIYDYMKNVDKLNSMINELKGCVAMSRGSLNNDYRDKIDHLCEIMSKFAEFMQKQEKKSLKPRKSVKKKAASRAPLSE